MCLEFPVSKLRPQRPSQDGGDQSSARAVGEIMLVSANGMDVSGHTSFTAQHGLSLSYVGTCLTCTWRVCYHQCSNLLVERLLQR